MGGSGKTEAWRGELRERRKGLRKGGLRKGGKLKGRGVGLREENNQRMEQWGGRSSLAEYRKA
jgi:hypothetical protein